MSATRRSPAPIRHRADPRTPPDGAHAGRIAAAPRRALRFAALLATAWLVLPPIADAQPPAAAGQTAAAAAGQATASGAAAGSAATDATRPRPSLLPLVQPLWSELTAPQQAVLAPFGAQWNTLPLEEKRAWVQLANRVPRMKEAERRKAEERIREWADLSPAERRVARQNFRLAKKLPQDQRAAQWEQYQQLTPEQQSVLRTSGTTSNTAARHAGSRTGLGKEAAQPISRVVGPGPAAAGPAGAVVPARHAD